MHDFKIGDRLYWIDAEFTLDNGDHLYVILSDSYVGISSGVFNGLTQKGMVKINDVLVCGKPEYYYKSKNDAIDAMISYLNQLKD